MQGIGIVNPPTKLFDIPLSRQPFRFLEISRDYCCLRLLSNTEMGTKMSSTKYRFELLKRGTLRVLKHRGQTKDAIIRHWSTLNDRFIELEHFADHYYPLPPYPNPFLM